MSEKEKDPQAFVEEEQDWKPAIQRLIKAYNDACGIFMPYEFKAEMMQVSLGMKDIKRRYNALRISKEKIEK